jgi:hypothetical protein
MTMRCTITVAAIVIASLVFAGMAQPAFAVTGSPSTTFGNPHLWCPPVYQLARRSVPPVRCPTRGMLLRNPGE